VAVELDELRQAPLSMRNGSADESVWGWSRRGLEIDALGCVDPAGRARSPSSRKGVTDAVARRGNRHVRRRGRAASRSIGPLNSRKMPARAQFGGVDAPTVFISYSHADKDYARRLGALLIERGIRVWIDFLELRAGDSVVHRMSEAIAEGDFLVAIVSPDSVKSSWCQRELALAQTRGINEKSVVVLPIRYRGAKMPPALVDAYWLDGDTDDVSAIADRLVHDIGRHRAPGKPSTDHDWLQDALRVYRTETPEAKDRWLFQLEGARLRAEMDVPIDGGRHYETVLKLCEVGALRELRRSRRFVVFAITDQGRLLHRILSERGQGAG
jgi:hypothetical protein